MPFLPSFQASSQQVPVMRAPVDEMRHGGRSLRLEALAPHPVEQIQATVCSSSSFFMLLTMDPTIALNYCMSRGASCATCNN